MNKRLVTQCSPEHECSDEEISAILEESVAVDNDPEVIRYDLPDINDLKTIVEKAESYTGEWYHSNVLVSETDVEDEEYNTLRNKAVELGTDHGIYISFTFEMNEDEEKAVEETLKKAFGLKS